MPVSFYISGQSFANDFQIRVWFCTPVVALPPKEELLPEVRVIQSMRRHSNPYHAPLKTPARSRYAGLPGKGRYWPETGFEGLLTQAACADFVTNLSS